MFVGSWIKERKTIFARLRAKEQRRKPPTKAQKRSQLSTKLFDKAMTRLNMFVEYGYRVFGKREATKKSEMVQESSSKKAGEDLSWIIRKKPKSLEENVEV
ncbi:hypothetical protein Tco_0820648 [Tanacetum coccineum]|uniref:Uncharacterized protein n=1 Tax=Tanacetum coccineum TaxID=301880 RepID=A0ABQ5ABP7_9ASTR